ncbi:TonB-dependent receptor [Mucilaginibacter xinganensis]|uniref:Outer membrane receptor protein, mostly Fe transport n=1 Tax=Mucilaginibacter xinganensis TaxID=1234841 RepID=A0A223NZ88_9SPHI|nr:TonB-dependent receptor [Mucilaginibacter xinganensis]ASU34898.1 Outer membrane receptor protein, mostly Fe transport [Mucilaginibacter xinganensis]
MKKLFLIILLLSCAKIYAQQVRISGTITDTLSNQPINGASITVKGKIAGTITDSRGHYTLNADHLKFPVTLEITTVGYGNKEIIVNSATGNNNVSLKQLAVVLNEVVTAATRVNQTSLNSPVSIEKMNQKAVRENPSFTFYDGLQNMKGIEAVTSSLTYKQVNTRGFNDTGNPRFLQLVDGVDNQTPGLNFAVGNLFGASDIDIESVEVIPGAASALYGPVAFNGAMLLHTKDAFEYQGLTLQAKSGINHIGETGVGAKGLYDFALRYAKAFNNKFAFKINASYLTGKDWYADNYTDISAQTAPSMRGPNNPGRDALNIYGDEVSQTLPGIGLVSRTGYEEKDLMNYNVYSLKLNGALEYKFNNNLEAIYQYNYGRGTASYTGSSRYDLNNFVLETHRLELKGSNFFLRSYAVIENSHDSYNTRSLAQFINRDWVQDLNGNTVTPDKADAMWFTRYQDAFNGSISGVAAHDNNTARAFADQGRLIPGTAAFNQAKDVSIHNYGLSGAGVFSNSKFYHTEGQYDFSSAIKIFDLQAGGNIRHYSMFTNGSLFDDKEHRITIDEYGAFVQAGKKLFDNKLGLLASVRYDKNENFKGSFTPRFSAVYSVDHNNNFRASYQTGFRNPTPVDQYINLNVGPITILGGAPANSKNLTVYQNSFTAASVSAFGGAFGADVANGKPFPQAVADNKDLLKKSNVAYIKPEQQKAFELGYKGLIADKLLIDINYYYSSYTDFILNTVVIAPQDNVIGNDGEINPAAASDILNGKIHAFQLYTNASDKVSEQGAGAGLTYLIPKGYSAGANVTLATFDLGKANQNNVAAFNTPKWSGNMMFANSNVSNGYGFNVNWHWQSAFDWYGTFNAERPGRINAYSLVDLQVNKKLPKANATVKLGASNIFNNHVYQAYGSPSIGAIYYVAITFDNLLR